MSRKNTEKQDSHYAKLRRIHREKNPIAKNTDSIFLYGTHTVLAALKNKHRIIEKIFVTANAYEKLKEHIEHLNYEILNSRDLNKLLNHEATHQGIVALARPLATKTISDFANSKLIVLLDQITDPHNIGAIMRSCVALNVDALITTQRHSPNETSVLAKTASGAFDMISFVAVRNLCQTLEDLHNLQFTTIGLDSAGQQDLYKIYEDNKFQKIALVLGAEGKGLREKTRQTVSKLARLDMPGAIKSLNVSNAAALALYLTNKYLKA